MLQIVKITIEDSFAEPSLKAKLMRKLDAFAERMKIDLHQALDIKAVRSLATV